MRLCKPRPLNCGRFIEAVEARLAGRPRPSCFGSWCGHCIVDPLLTTPAGFSLMPATLMHGPGSTVLVSIAMDVMTKTIPHSPIAILAKKTRATCRNTPPA